MTRLTLLTTPVMIIALSFVTACASGPKRGQGESNQIAAVSTHPVGLYFVGHDANDDGVTSRAELDAGIKKDWAKFDRNPSAAQFQNWTTKAFGSSSAMPTFLSFDSNMNGVITQSEFETRLVGEFNRLDKNGDGRIARSELIFNVRQRGSEARSQGERGGEDRPSRGEGRPPR
ncbi:MAG: EF-hand domain-containing protein [Litorimonas sp.]